MTDEDKQYLVEKVGLKWHEPEGVCDRTCGGICHICDTPISPNLDPLDPADMYGKTWVAFKEKGEFYIWLIKKSRGKTTWWAWDILTSPPDLAQAMLEYFKEKEDE